MRGATNRQATDDSSERELLGRRALIKGSTTVSNRLSEVQASSQYGEPAVQS